MNLGDGHALCVEAGRNPDETVASFTLTDYAAVLLGTTRSSREIVELLRSVRTPRLGDALLAASGWGEIFEAYADSQDERG